MASTTKITTAVLTLAHARLNALVPVSKNAASIGESTMVLQQGERLTVRQLLYGLLLNSANDAAIALAEYVGGSERHFVAMMNELARSLGMRNTHYVTPHGLDAPHHYSSARDLATVALYAMRDPTFRQIVSTIGYHIKATRHNHEHWLASVNRVMYWFPGVDGIKPGQTDGAGLCQVVSAWRGGHHLIAVLLNTPTLVFDIRNLLDFGGHDFRWVQAPAYWDTPANSLEGGRGSRRWLYLYGAGHYIRGDFLHYYQSHGGLQTLGYPRTDALWMFGRLVQFFQGGELVADPTRASVYPVALGSRIAAHLLPKIDRRGGPLVHGFAGAYAGFGGVGVLGPPVTGPVTIAGDTTQFYRYGAIGEINGAAQLLPLGDAALRHHHWLPAIGAADTYPPSLSPALLPTIGR